MGKDFFIPVSFGDWLNTWIRDLVANHGDFLHEVSKFLLQTFLLPVERSLLALPPVLMLALVAALTWYGMRRWVPVVAYSAGLYLIGCIGLWDETMKTLAIMLVSIILCLLIGLPMGVWMSRSRRLSQVVTPILDVMQTFPMFVYMLPIVMLFSVGKVPAVLGTVIYSLPPLIRLTELGIRQVDAEVREAATSFGGTRWQMLIWVELPLARPSIMAGINQTTMLALAMVVVASMIGAPGLGVDILDGLTNLNFGKGAHAGLAIVILAIVIDRVTQSYGQTARQRALRGAST
jgi:glycine betaine/proline transport system permease protein